MNHLRRFQLPVAVLVAAALLACTRPAPAGDPEDDAGPVLAAAQEAVAHGRVVQSNQLGFGNDKGAFSDAPDDGGVLIGFDLGVGRLPDAGRRRDHEGPRPLPQQDAAEEDPED